MTACLPFGTTSLAMGHDADPETASKHAVEVRPGSLPTTFSPGMLGTCIA